MPGKVRITKRGVVYVWLLDGRDSGKGWMSFNDVWEEGQKTWPESTLTHAESFGVSWEDMVLLLKEIHDQGEDLERRVNKQGVIQYRLK